MARTITLLLLLAASISASAQLTITEPGESAPINGTLVTIEGSPDVFDLEHALTVTNTSSADLAVGCRRIELAVEPSTGAENTLCWVLCPAYLMAGSQPTFTSGLTASIGAFDLDTSFVMHMRPHGVDGCSLFRVEWFNADDDTEVYATVDMMFDHSDINNCAVGIQELNQNLELSLSPNPSTEFVNVVFGDISTPVNVIVGDILGQQVKAEHFVPNADNMLRLSTLDMRNGVYFLSVEAEGSIVKTVKFVVRH